MDKSLLLGMQVPTDTVDLGAVTVTVRGLTRAQALEVSNTGSSLEIERLMLHYGLVDPALTLEDAAEWQESAPTAAVRAVSDRIVELSGMREGADKSNPSANGAGPYGAVQPSPSAPAEEDAA